MGMVFFLLLYSRKKKEIHQIILIELVDNPQNKSKNIVMRWQCLHKNVDETRIPIHAYFLSSEEFWIKSNTQAQMHTQRVRYVCVVHGTSRQLKIKSNENGSTNDWTTQYQTWIVLICKTFIHVSIVDDTITNTTTRQQRVTTISCRFPQFKIRTETLVDSRKSRSD